MDLSTYEVIGAVCAIMGVVGGLIARDRYVLKLIADTKVECNKTVNTSSKELHDRVSKHRDSIDSKYMSKDEYEARQKALEHLLININTNVDKLVDMNHKTNERIDKVMINKMNDS